MQVTTFMSVMGMSVVRGDKDNTQTTRKERCGSPHSAHTQKSAIFFCLKIGVVAGVHSPSLIEVVTALGQFR